MAQTIRKVANKGPAIPAGTAVTYDGPLSPGSDLYKVLAANPLDLSKMPAVGVVLQDIADGTNATQYGLIATGGSLGSVFGLEPEYQGQPVYVGTNGALTLTPPGQGAFVQEVAVLSGVYFELTIDIEEVTG